MPSPPLPSGIPCGSIQLMACSSGGPGGSPCPRSPLGGLTGSGHWSPGNSAHGRTRAGGTDGFPGHCEDRVPRRVASRCTVGAGLPVERTRGLFPHTWHRLQGRCLDDAFAVTQTQTFMILRCSYRRLIFDYMFDQVALYKSNCHRKPVHVPYSAEAGVQNKPAGTGPTPGAARCFQTTGRCPVTFPPNTVFPTLQFR